MCWLYSQLNHKIWGDRIMTNHTHLIMGNGPLSDTIRDLKRFTSREIMKTVDENERESRKEWMKIVFQYHAKYNKRSGERQFWTHENHAVQLDSNDMIDSKLNYIHKNPVRAGWVEEAEHYLYSSQKLREIESSIGNRDDMKATRCPRRCNLRLGGPIGL